MFHSITGKSEKIIIFYICGIHKYKKCAKLRRSAMAQIRFWAVAFRYRKIILRRLI
jgi:hypothetical protein